MQENTVSEISSYELSVNQKNQWYVDDSESSMFYNQVVLKLDNTLELTKLKEAIHAVILKNETLLFKTLKITNLLYPKQFIDKTEELEFFTVTANDNESKSALIQQHMEYPYDISKNAPIRFCYATTDTTKELTVRIYSFWADSYSTVMFCSDLEKSLTDIEAYRKNEREVVEYQNFSAWQNELFHEPEMEGVNFWKNYEYVLGRSSIPFINDAVSNFSPAKKCIAHFKDEKYTKLKEVATAKNTSVELLLFAKFADYLKQFEHEKITIGYIPFNRSYEELSNTFGTVTKTLPIVINTTEDTNNYESVIQKSIEDIGVWADYFYINREKSKQLKKEYFNYNFEYIDVSKQANNTHCHIENFYAVTDVFDLKISCVDTGKEVFIDAYFDTNKAAKSVLDVLIAQLTSKYDIFSEANGVITKIESEIIAQANHTEKQFSEHNSVLEMFTAKVAETPQAIGVVYEDQQISYEELDQKSSQLANYLRVDHDIKKGDAIGIVLDRSEWFVIAMLGILKTGAFYIPIDTTYPEERIQFILKDGAVKLTISSAELQNKFSFSAANTLLISDENIYNNTANNLEKITILPEDTAYCIYTSGSTGQPKGCKITHSNLLNYVQWANDYYFTKTTGNWGLITSLSFDLTVTALYTSLTRGKKLHIGSAEKDIIQLLEETFANPAIDTLKLTPTHLTILKDIQIDATKVRTIICGGEQLQKSQLEIVRTIHPDIKVYNEYGPTETTVGCIVKEVSFEDEKILIGKPIANTQIQIVNEALNAVGIGITGEIHVCGSGVSSGYINRTELNAEKFIKIAGVKSYKTGDLGRWFPDGNIEYIGRADDQVKIRGFRIELGELENVLTNHTDATQVVVLMHEEEDVKDLTAFLVIDKAISQEELRTTLLRSFPEYMIPSAFIQISKMPLTTHGKVNKKELLEIREQELLKTVKYVAPRNELEEKIATIWEKLFEKDKIGIKDDFFLLGGHSIKLIKLINHYQSVFGVKLELNQFFINTTVESQANIINSSMNTKIDNIENVEEALNYPLSLMQRRLWLLSQNKERSIAYNMYSYNNIGEVDEECFKKALGSIIERHESLRTIFKKDDAGEVKQWIISAEELDFKVHILDLSQSENYDQAFENYIKIDSQIPFDLENGPLIKVTLIKKSESEYIFYKNIHHIMADNWSLDVLSKEYSAYYLQHKYNVDANLEALSIQYKDYAVWQINRKSSEAFLKKKEYWLSKFEEKIPKLNLLFSKERPLIKTYNGIEITNKIYDPSINKFFSAAQGEKGVTPFMKALAILNVLLYHNSFQTDIIVGSPVAGRDNPQLKDQIGLYINTIPFRNKINVNDDFTTLLETIKTNVVGAYKNNDYPFDLMVEDLNIQVDLSRNPLFDVMLVVTHEVDYLDNVEAGETEEFEEKIELEITSKFDITFYVELKEDELEYRIHFNSDLFDLESMTLLSSQFSKLLHLLAKDNSRNILEYCEEIKEEKSKSEHDEFIKSFGEDLNEDF